VLAAASAAFACARPGKASVSRSRLAATPAAFVRTRPGKAADSGAAAGFLAGGGVKKAIAALCEGGYNRRLSGGRKLMERFHFQRAAHRAKALCAAPFCAAFGCALPVRAAHTEHATHATRATSTALSLIPL